MKKGVGVRTDRQPTVILCESYDSLREGVELALSERYRLRCAEGIDETARFAGAKELIG